MIYLSYLSFCFLFRYSIACSIFSLSPCPFSEHAPVRSQKKRKADIQITISSPLFLCFLSSSFLCFLFFASLCLSFLFYKPGLEVGEGVGLAVGAGVGLAVGTGVGLGVGAGVAGADPAIEKNDVS